jgi:hypothetical protein
VKGEKIVLIGEVKGVSDVLDLGKVVVMKYDGYHIESCLRIVEPPFGEPYQRSFGDLPLLERGDG